MLGETQNPFSFARAALSTCGRAKANSYQLSVRVLMFRLQLIGFKCAATSSGQFLLRAFVKVSHGAEVQGS